MAGKRQHYVPQLLQRGFLHPAAADEAERTWLHRRNQEARLVGIRDVGVEDWFYSRKSPDGSPTLDDAITELEQEVGARVGALRQTPPGTVVAPGETAEMLVHLVTRTAHLRRLMSQGLHSTQRELELLLTDPTRLSEMLGLAGPVLGPMLIDAVRDGALQLAPNGIPPAFSERLMKFVIRENGEMIVGRLVETFAPLFPGLFKGLEDRVRETHNKVLETAPDTNKWVSALAAFEWSIEAAAELILPDAVALAREEGGDFMAMLFTNAEDAREIVMPLTPDRILVGRKGAGRILDLSSFNRQAAANSEAFFVAARSFDDEQLSDLIGTEARTAMEQTIATAVAEASQSRLVSETNLPPTLPQQFQWREFSYVLHLFDFGDDILAKEYASILNGVIGALSRDLPLHDLDGVTLAIDYDAALAALDRGDVNLPPVTRAGRGYGHEVAKPVTVIRDGVEKSHLVVAASHAQTWLSAERNERAQGLHTLVKMLASIGHTARYPDVRLENFEPDIMYSELHGFVGQTPAKYWSARQAAFVDPDQGQIYREITLDSIAFAEREISEARAAMTSDDIGPVMRSALPAVSAVLGHVADRLGHRDGLSDGEGFAGSGLPEDLAAWDLGRWIELFGRDLAASYRADGSLDVDVIVGLDQHVERLLWCFGIYCWPDDGMRCLVTEQSLRPSALIG